MNEEAEKEKVKDVSPVEEYLNNYKEQKLAEFCVEKDREIGYLMDENYKLIKEKAELREKAESYEKVFKNMNNLYAKIRKLSVDDYLRLYHMIYDSINNNSCTYTTCIAPYLNDATHSDLATYDRSW